MISQFGGIFFAADRNLAKAGSLEHTLEEIRAPLFGQELYPTLIEKAALIGWRIIAGHIFHDGNKRTGMEACHLFLAINGYTMLIDFEIVEMAISVAKGETKLPEFTKWVEERTIKDK